MPPQPVSGVHSVLHPQIWTPRQHPTGVQISNHQESGRHVDTQQASKSTTTKNLDATSTPNRRPNQQPPRIWTPPQPVSGVQSALHLKSGRHPNHRLASNPPYISNLDATTIPNRRPIRPRFPIWTPRQPPTGVQSALHLKSGRRANRPLASNPPYNSNLDAAPTTHWRPIRPTPQIWTPPQPVSGVQSALHLKSGRRPNRPLASIPPCTPKSGRRANHSLASISPYNPNLDAAPTRKWRPIRPTPQIWTPRQPPTGVQSAIQLKSGRRPVRKWRPFRPRFSIWTPPQPVSGVLPPIPYPPVPQMSSLKPPAPQI